MAGLLTRNFYPLYGSIHLKHVLKRTELLSAVRCLSSVLNLRNGYSKKCKPIMPIYAFRYLNNTFDVNRRHSSKSAKENPINLDSLVEYENVSEETLQSLYERFEDVLQGSKFEDWDVNYSNGVLTATLKENYIYVINKQTPNRQIWLSSPQSGPKRYDYLNGTWIYKHDGMSLHELLSNELTSVLQTDANFMNCSFSN